MKLKIIFSSLLILTLLNCINNEGLIRELPEIKEDKTEHDLSKAINIYIDGNNQIFVDKEKINIKELKARIREYEFKNKSESIITLKSERTTMYKVYIDVQNAIVGEIRVLRKQLAKEKYNKKLDNLTEEQLSEIRKVYPQKLVE